MDDHQHAHDGRYRTLDDLRKAIDSALGEVLADTTECALFGFPDHSNVGDSAIWLGELEYLEGRGIDVRYACSSRSYREDSLRSAIGNGTILLHGGGSFGDVWPEYHSTVLDFISRHHANRIVVMPQTIHFHTDQVARATRTALHAHGNVTLVVRDLVSFGIARDRLDHDAHLCPDLALWLSPPDTKGPTAGVLFLRRQDRESGQSDVEIPNDVVVTDWLGLAPASVVGRAEYAALYRLNRRLTTHLANINRYEPRTESLASTIRNSLARLRLKLGLDLLGSGKVIVTDRLHAHLLGLLLHKQGVLLDNSYGKVRSFYDTWTRDIGQFQWAESVDRALTIGVGMASTQTHRRFG